MNENISTISCFLRSYIATVDLALDHDIFQRGFNNSLFFVQLITFLEQKFDIEIPDEELELENFKSLAAMNRLIERLRVQAPLNS